MKDNLNSKLTVRLTDKEKEMLFYFANKLGISPSALVRNQVKKLMSELEEKLTDKYYVELTELDSFHGPKFSQDDIEDFFEISK